MLNVQKISSQQLQQFSQQLASLLKAGITLSNALELLKPNVKKPSWEKLLTEIHFDIQQGLSLNAALSKFPAYFASYYCSLIRCGEKTGHLVQILEQLARYQQRKLNFKRKCWRALSYPSFILLTSLVICLAILVWIIPLFQDLFAQNHQSLPKLTQSIIHFSEHLPSYAIIITLSFILSGYLISLLLKGYFPFRWKLMKLSIQCPGVSHLIRLVQLNRWLALMSSHLEAGIHLFDSLKASNTAFNHLYYQAAAAQLLSQLEAGSSLSRALQLTQLFPEHLVKLISLGEETGNMSSLFVEAMYFYEQELENLLVKFTQLIEPVSLLLISLLVGMLVMALYMPLFNMGDVF